jgi:beta-galactosidase
MKKSSQRLITFAMIIGALLSVIQLNAQTTASLSGTDIYNGLRGQNFDEGWKFNKGDVSGGQNTSYNDSGWSNVTLPHDWSIYNSFNQSSAAGSNGAYLDGGIGWYRKTFTVPADYNGKKVFIEIDGAYMNSQVWLNGTSLGTRPYGYNSFEYDLTPYLVYGGSNVVAVKLNNNQPNSRWYSGSGLYRNVWLTALNPVHVDYCGMFVTTPTVTSSSATVNVSTKVLNQSGSSQSVTLTTTIMDANGNTVAISTSSATNIAAGGNNTFSQNSTISNPKLWSPSSPYLYMAQTQVSAGGSVVDTFKSTFGIRYFNFDANTGFSLNGANMKINGVCNHHDLGALGAAVNYRAIERQYQILKAMGCNAIRMAHNPPDPMVLEICDRLGFLVMDEVFDCWETGKTTNDYHLYFNTWAQADLQAMIYRDRNHPSIIIWNIGNEIPSPTAATATKLKNWVKAIDTTRPVACAMFAVSMGDAEPIAVANVLDLVGYNYFPYMYDSGHSGHPAWKMFGSETSSALRSRSIYKTPTNTNILNSSDNQCSSYDNSWPSWGNSAESSYSETNRRAWIAGEFVWTGFDYLGEPTPYSWPSKSSYFGMADTCGFPKDIYYFYQSKWSTTPMVHVLPHWNWSGGTVEVWAYSNCDTVELFLNGVSQGSKSMGTNLHLVWNVSWASGTLQVKGTKGSTVVYDQVTTAGAAAKVQLKPDRTSINADGKDLVYVETNITDANNVLVPTATNTVNFSVSGPGTIVGVDNGNGASTESYKGNSRMAFSGKCLVIVQTTKTSGSIVVTASSNGLSSASATITSIGEGTPGPTAEPTVPPTPGPENLALNKTASADSAQTGNVAANGNDGNTGTRWCANDASTNHWWMVDLGASYNLTGTEVMWEFSAAYQYKVETSMDNSAWTLNADKTGNTATGQTMADNFTVQARYVRITVTGLPAGDWASFFEIAVFGTSIAITPEPTAAPTPAPTIEPACSMMGDVNGSGTIDIVDALLVAQAYVGLNPANFDSICADVNCSGTVDIVDALLVAQYYVGLISSFPC